ncbi:NYN domain-containing protein [Roseovarius sp. THAF27]|uniref:NYN domain-containing protein n=1 Tax=Roseovarius sp. THAF27 TaxID=2587850 RepID=UPI001561EF2F|nr:NYN domain-containing protein [Roseovarius sp. THAF27]
MDGFNLYHAIDDLRQQHLKWLDLWRLGELVARGHASSIEEVVFCSAYFPGNHGKKVRHTAYKDALENAGVRCLMGHTTKEPMECKTEINGCGNRWDQPREKETDINLALSLYNGAIDDIYDVAFLITADTDQAATLKMVRRRFADKQLIAVYPPGRQVSKHLRDLTDKQIRLKEQHIDECLFPPMVMAKGKRTIIRPHEYAPPEDWVHPDKRPK